MALPGPCRHMGHSGGVDCTWSAVAQCRVFERRDFMDLSPEPAGPDPQLSQACAVTDAARARLRPDLADNARRRAALRTHRTDIGHRRRVDVAPLAGACVSGNMVL